MSLQRINFASDSGQHIEISDDIRNAHHQVIKIIMSYWPSSKYVFDNNESGQEFMPSKESEASQQSETNGSMNVWREMHYEIL